MRRLPLASSSYVSSRPDNWTQPRPHSDPSLRLHKYGRVRPMEEPSFWDRLLGRH